MNLNYNKIQAHEHIPELEQAPTSINTWVLIVPLTKIAFLARFGGFCKFFGLCTIQHNIIYLSMYNYFGY